MLRSRRSIALGLLLAAPGLLAPALLAQTGQATAAPTTTQHHRSHKAQKPLVLPPLPRGPLRQVPMDQIPPAPAKVSYQNGLLTISAQNSTLSEILHEVQRLTGASIDIPQSSAANERVVTSLGPGAPRDVLAGLLNGCSFNYVMLGSNSDPAAVSSVVLTAKPSSSGDNVPAPNMTARAYQDDSAPVPPTLFPQGRSTGNCWLSGRDSRGMRKLRRPTTIKTMTIKMTTAMTISLSLASRGNPTLTPSSNPTQTSPTPDRRLLNRFWICCVEVSSLGAP